MIGMNHNDILELDLWQFYGYLRILRRKAKEKAKEKFFQDKVLELLYLTASAWGLKTDPEEFFKREKEIEAIFNEDDEVCRKEGYDPLEGKGEYIEGEWVYNFAEMIEIRQFFR